MPGDALVQACGHANGLLGFIHKTLPMEARSLQSRGRWAGPLPTLAVQEGSLEEAAGKSLEEVGRAEAVRRHRVQDKAGAGGGPWALNPSLVHELGPFQLPQSLAVTWGC